MFTGYHLSLWCNKYYLQNVIVAPIDCCDIYNNKLIASCMLYYQFLSMVISATPVIRDIITAFMVCLTEMYIRSL